MLTGCQNGKSHTANLESGGQEAVNNQMANKAEISPTVVASSAALSSDITMALYREPKLKGCMIAVSVSNTDGSIMLLGTIVKAEQEKTAIQISENMARKGRKNPKIVSRLRIELPQSRTSESKMQNKPAAKHGSGKALKKKKM